MPPDVSNVTLSYMYSDDVVDDTIFTAEEHDIGLEWEGGKEDVAFYEWEIGSSPGTDDVFPRIMFGITESKKAYIRDGKLWIDETPLNASVGEFANTTWSNETMKAAKMNTFFNLEPGKCVYVTLYAVGRSHLSSTVYSNPLCIKRTKDSALELGTPDKRKRKSSKLHGEILLQDTTTKVSADIIIKGINVTILAGILNQTDVTADYGTAASAKYTRYLIDPCTRWEDTSRFLRHRLVIWSSVRYLIDPCTRWEDTSRFLRHRLVIWSSVRYLIDPCTRWEDTSRFLRHRLKQYAGLMFYLSPSTSVESLTEISINVMFDSSLFDTNTEIPVLVYWDNFQESWNHPSDTCNDVTDKTDFVNKVFTTQACKEVFSKTTSTRKKRSVPTSVPLPRMWSLMVMSRKAPNTPPRITTSELFVGEDMDDLQDKNGQRVIQYVDSESDDVEFTILQPPFHGQANITSDGTVYYFPDSNYNGADFIIVKVVETGLLPPFHPLSATRTITINIAPINDAPVLLPFESALKFEEIEIPGKGLNSVQILLDGNVTKKYDLGQVTFMDFDFVDPSINEINYTMRINNTLLKCDDIERASSFEKYSCKCDRGYTDQWCQTDINECDPNPCSVFYDCEDLIGYQKCNLNLVKTILLTLAVLLILVMCFMLIRRYYKKKRPNKIDPGSNTWSFGSEDLGQKKGRFIRPTSASSTEDLVPSCTVRDINVDIGKHIIPLCTVRETNVGNRQLFEEKVDTHTENTSETGDRIVLLSEKTIDSLTKTLEPISTLTATIGLKAPHHKPLRMKTGCMSLIKLTKFGNKNIEGPTGKRTLRPVILADSKGVRLQQQFIQKDQSNIIWWCKRGRKVHEAIDWLKTNLETEIQLIGDIWLYIWVGTCNLTSFDRSTRYICLSSSKSQETVDQVTTTYKDIIQLFAKYPNCKLTFLETPFYSIVNWNSKQKHKNPSTFLEQDHLLQQQVILLNKEVKTINSSLGTHSPDFSYDLYRTSNCKTANHKGKKQRKYFNVALYPDGIHPDPVLAKVWLKKLVVQIFRDCWTR
ncbi:Hypothetical predicted protein [Mytilus galloprovincialis]|uniref:Cadherin domain-containing protein n=1 Tax=Mytilus galloprovincialis TaxID=29158 RepID=A0A8B6GGN0_MYTGA|nr:Hypothetical predicted protein [Mytilus galloprovincialis]